MKFGENLQCHITPEWRKQYIEYERLKSMLYEAQENVPSTEETDEFIVERFLANFHELFFRVCEQELKKINIFYSEKYSEAMRKFASLNSDLELLRSTTSKHKPAVKRGTQFSARTQHDLKLAFSEFYLSIILLQNYQKVNFTGFRKILKKHDKLMGSKAGSNWRISKVETSPFYTSKEVETCIEEVENIVTSELEGGNRAKAMKRLRVPPLEEKQNPWTTFRVGLYMGVSFVLLAITILTAFYVKIPVSWQHVVRLYRAPMLIIIFLYLIGANTYGWSTSGVNHVLIFELDPRNHLTYQRFLEVAGLFATVWGISFLLFLFSSTLKIPALIHPLWMFIFLLVYLCNPITKFPHYSSRRWLLKTLYRLATAPFHKVAFADFWLADQLNSLALVLLDIQYFVCFYASEVEWNGPNYLNGIQEIAINSTANVTASAPIHKDYCTTPQYAIRPIIACLPAWFRFAQCWRRYHDTKHVFPHVVNAFKYSTSFFVVIFSTLSGWYESNNPDAVNVFFWLWLVSAIISSCYTYTWDIKMDWGLFDRSAGENKFLREETVYRFNAYYYFAMIEDFILRFTWTITMSVSQHGFVDGEILRTILGAFEVFRRFVWNYFRLENEHINNCGEFRAVRDISITPLDHSDLVMLENIMDEENGIMDYQPKDAKGKVRRRDVTKNFSTIEEEDEDQQTDTWTTFKGGITSWLKSRDQDKSVPDPKTKQV